MKTELSKLIENDLEQAKLVIAAQDVLDRLQKIAEHLAELGAEEIMPLSDNMKAAFGPDIAKEFEHTANQAIQTALQSVRDASDAIDAAILKVQGGANMDMENSDGQAVPPNAGDMSDDAEEFNQTVDQEADTELQDGDDTILGDDGFSGSEATATEEPLGRAQRESIQDKKALVESACVTLGKKLIMTESLSDMITWLLEDARTKLSSDNFEKFKNKVNLKLEDNPLALAGMIGMKRLSSSPTISPSAKNISLKVESKWSPDERKARGIAKVIEANIMAYGHGRASNVLKQFTSTDIRENCEKTLIETFKDIFGSTPAEYSVKLRKEMMEDITPSNNPSPEDSDISSDPTNTTPNLNADPNLTTIQKANAAKGIAKMASDIGDNQGNLQKPLATAMTDLSGQEKQAVDTVVSNIDSQTGQEPDKVGELLQKASDVIGENISLIAKAPPSLVESLIRYNTNKGNMSFVNSINSFLGK